MAVSGGLSAKGLKLLIVCVAFFLSHPVYERKQSKPVIRLVSYYYNESLKIIFLVKTFS